MQENLELCIGDDISIKKFTLIERLLYSTHHINSAAFFTRMAAELEINMTKNTSESLVFDYTEKIPHYSYVTGAILCSVSFLEAFINEYLGNIADGYAIKQPPDDTLNKNTLDQIRKMWELNVPRTASFKILQKYQIALTLAGKSWFETGDVIYQNVDVLIKLRNALVHFEPETVVTHSSINERKLHRLESGLKGKFKLNPMYRESMDSFFPDGCISHGCSEWAVQSSSIFVKEFCNKMGIRSYFRNNNLDLKTK